MKYIITERQFELLNESIPIWVLRRLDKEYLSVFIKSFFDVHDSQTDFCEEFQNEDEFLSNLFRWVTDEFLLSNESYEWDEDFDDVHEYVKKKLYTWFKDEMEQYYLETCK